MTERDVSFPELVAKHVTANRQKSFTLLDSDTIVGMMYRQAANIIRAAEKQDFEKVLRCMVETAASLQMTSEICGWTEVAEDAYTLEQQIDDLRQEVRKFVEDITDRAVFGKPAQKGGKPPYLIKIEQDEIQDLMKERFNKPPLAPPPSKPRPTSPPPPPKEFGGSEIPT